MNPDKKLELEIIVVMLLTMGRSIAGNIAGMLWLGDPPIRPFGYFQFTECLRALYLSGLVLLVVSLKGESWVELGLTTPRWGKDFGIALLVMCITVLLWIPFPILAKMLGHFDLQKSPKPFLSPSSTAESLWICVSALFVGFAEELLTRGYLISRLLRLFGPVKSIIYSSLVFSAWHISQYPSAVARTFIWGLVYGFAFTKVRRLWPLALAHAMNNAIVDL